MIRNRLFRTNKRAAGAECQCSAHAQECFRWWGWKSSGNVTRAWQLKQHRIQICCSVCAGSFLKEGLVKTLRFPENPEIFLASKLLNSTMKLRFEFHQFLENRNSSFPDFRITNSGGFTKPAFWSRPLGSNGDGVSHLGLRWPDMRFKGLYVH